LWIYNLKLFCRNHKEFILPETAHKENHLYFPLVTLASGVLGRRACIINQGDSSDSPKNDFAFKKITHWQAAPALGLANFLFFLFFVMAY